MSRSTPNSCRTTGSVIFWVSAGLACVHAGYAQRLEEASLEELRQARDSLVAVADFPGALEPAEEIVARLEDDAADGLDTDLLILARVQAGVQEFDAAELSYLEAIEIIRDQQGESARSLVPAYQGLGRVYLNSRRFEEALIAFEAGQVISRRNDGLFNVEQSALIDDMTLAHLGIGNTLAARELQLARLENAVRRFGEDDPRLIPFHSHLGEYYDNSRLRVSAREEFSKALELSRAHGPVDSNESLSLLRRVAELDLLLDQPGDAHAQMTEILERSADVDPIQRGLTLAALGDWAIVNEDLELARWRYREAYEALAPNIDVSAYFGSPRMLNFVPPLSPVDRGARSRPWAWGTVVLEFEVSADGRASNVATVSMEPQQDDVASAYDRRIREAYFRPRLVDGATAPTSSVTYTQSFRYYVNTRSRRRRNDD